MPRVRTMVYAAELAAEAIRTGEPADRFAPTVLQACLDDWAETLTPGVAPADAEVAGVNAKADAINAAGFRSQFALLLGRYEECDDQLEHEADELLRRIRLDAALRPPPAPLQISARGPQNVRIEMGPAPEVPTDAGQQPDPPPPA